MNYQKKKIVCFLGQIIGIFFFPNTHFFSLWKCLSNAKTIENVLKKSLCNVKSKTFHFQDIKGHALL